MLSSLDEIPDYERSILTERYFDRWLEKVQPDDSEGAKAYVQETFVYMIRMFWQGRLDKMDTDSRALFDWVSLNALPEDAGYKGTGHGFRLADGANGDRLAREVFDEFWSLYETSPASGLKRQEQQSLFDRMRGFLRF